MWVKNRKSTDDLENVCCHGCVVDRTVLPNVINQFLVALTSDIPMLDQEVIVNLKRECVCCPDMYIVSEFDVYNVLCRLKKAKQV